MPAGAERAGSGSHRGAVFLVTDLGLKYPLPTAEAAGCARLFRRTGGACPELNPGISADAPGTRSTGRENGPASCLAGEPEAYPAPSTLA